jgi:hypothetical protein
MQSNRILSAQDVRTLRFVLRSRFTWTFFDMGRFAALCLLFCGVYLLADAIREPLEASETVILTGGFTLAFASFLLTYLVWPRATDFRKRAASRQWHTFRRPVLRLYHEGAHARRHSTRTSEHQRGLM